jgi:hypothetical protein
VTVSDVNGPSSTELYNKVLLRAVVISLLLHVLIFSVWRVGRDKGWWNQMVMPRWMQAVSKAMMPVIPKKPPVDDISRTQLTFVEVDPALAVPAPPKKPKFQGSQNTVAANREIKILSEAPNIEGHQNQFNKTIDDGTALPKPKPTPTPVAPTQPQTAPPKTAPAQSVPRKAYTPGDLAMVRPSDKPEEGKADAEASQQAQVQAQPQPPSETHKPRTLAEALAKNGIPGPQTHQIGGVGNVTPNISQDVQGTPLGDYIEQMVDAVRSHWYQLLENQTAESTGKVVLHFRLLPDGRVTNMSVVQNEVSDLLQMFCQRAVLDPKFPKWPREMRLSLPNDYYDVTFTFFYEP